MTTVRNPKTKKIERVQHYINHQDWHSSNTLKMPKVKKVSKPSQRSKR